MTKTNDGLRVKTYTALIWSFVDKAGEQVTRFVFSIVLARLLLPKDYGVIGMAFVVIELARMLVQGGFGYALINKSDATKVDECSVFYFNIVVGALAVIALYFVAPLISSFYKVPVLVPVIRVLSLDIVFGSIGTIQTVLMTKAINFKAQTKVSFPSTIISGVTGIYFASIGYGVWALVIQALTRSFLYTVLIWSFHTWRPQLKISKDSLKYLFKFGSKLMLGNIATVVYNNIYTILIGKAFSTTQLGYFTRAQQTQQMPVGTLSFIIWRVAYPVFSAIKSENERFVAALSKASGSIAFLVFPSLIVCSVIAKNLFIILFGERWLPSVEMFQILCVASIFAPLVQIRNNAITSKGKPGTQLVLQIVTYSSTLLSILITFRYGINYLLYGFGIVSYGNFLLNSIVVERVTGYSLKKQFLDLFPVLAISILAGIAAYAVGYSSISNRYVLVALQVMAAAGTYFGVSYLCKSSVLDELFKMVRKNRK